MLGHVAAHQRSGDRGHAPDRRQIALVAAALTRGHDIGDGGLRQRHQAATAQPLQRAEQDQLVQRLRQRAQHRRDDEQADGDRQQLAAPVDVGKLAVDRRGDGRGDQISGDDPGQMPESIQVRGDGGHGGDHPPSGPARPAGCKATMPPITRMISRWVRLAGMRRKQRGMERKQRGDEAEASGAGRRGHMQRGGRRRKRGDGKKDQPNNRGRR